MICIWSSWRHCHLISSCFIKIQIGLTFLVPAYTSCPGKEDVKQMSIGIFLGVSVHVDITAIFQVTPGQRTSSWPFQVTGENPCKAGCLLVAWSSGKALVFGRSAFTVLRSTCSWRVTTYVGKPSAIGQPTRPTQPFILSGSINEQWAAIGCLLPQLLWWWHLVNATKARQAWCCLQVKLCDPCLSDLCVPWCKKRRYINTLPFLFLSFLMPTREISRSTSVFNLLISAGSETVWNSMLYRHLFILLETIPPVLFW